MRLQLHSYLTMALLATWAAPAVGAAERVGIWEWEGASRVVSIGDVHGGYEKLVSLLEGSDLIDGEQAWVGGESHLVVAGDYLDRGKSERPILDLLRRLQAESQAAGGYVHVLLGNHESMNLQRDLRYVNPAVYAAYVDYETEKERKAAWKGFVSGRRGGGRPVDLREEFNRSFPPGYFGRLKLFDGDGEIGAWLLQRPAVVRIDQVVYLHGGLTERFASLGVDGINRRLLDQLQVVVESRRVLERARIVTPTMGFKELVEAIQFELAGSDAVISGRVRQAAVDLLQASASPILGGRGPLWYRGNSYEDERLERDMLDRSLELVGASAMVVAHSYTGGNKITSRFQGQLYRLDHGILESPRPLALVVEKGDVMVLDPASRELTQPIQEPPTGQVFAPVPDLVAPASLELFLERAAMTDVREIGRGTTRPSLVVLEDDGRIERGIFKSVDEGPPAAGSGSSDRYQHEVAAYLLDRKLGLGMVPATVIREVGGHSGSLQWWVQGAVDGQAAEAYDLGLYRSEEALKRLADGEIFDALIGNRDRKPADILRRVHGGEVFLIDHSKAFSISPEIPWDPAARPLLPEPLAVALRALDRTDLEAALGELLSPQQIEALLDRRDRILERVVTATR